MVSVLASSALDNGFEHHSGQAKTIKLAFATSDLSTRVKGVSAKTGWLGIRIMCLRGAVCIPTDCCFSELALYKYN